MTNNKMQNSDDLKKLKKKVKLSWAWEGLINEQLSDMTLACDDGELKVHKVVLASTSPVLKRILAHNTHPSPLIYLSEVTFENLQNLVDFMYKGEVNVAYTALETFAEVAEYLRLKGLSLAEKDEHDKDDTSTPKRKKIKTKENNKPIEKENVLEENHIRPKQNEIVQEKKEIVPVENDISIPDVEIKSCIKGTQIKLKKEKETKSKMEPIEEKKTNVGDMFTSEEKSCADDEEDTYNEEILEPKIKMEVHKNYIEPKMEVTKKIKNEKPFPCTKCNKKFHHKRNVNLHLMKVHNSPLHCNLCSFHAKTSDNLQLHIRTTHEGFDFACGKCPKKFTQRRNLRKHENTFHGSEQFSCDQCNYKSTSKAYLNSHLQNHTGARYFCDKCDYRAKSTGRLKVHIQSIHEGLRYPCDRCVYQATEKMSLKKHIQIVHDAVRFPCEYCDYKATRKLYLTKHIEKRHA